MSGGQDCNLWILREHSSANTANKRKPVKQVMAHLYNRINAIEPLKNKAAPKSWNSMSWNHPQDIYSGCCCLAASHVWLFCDPINCSLPGSSIHGILQARILEWVAIPFSRGSSWPRDRAWIYCIGRWILYHWPTREAPRYILSNEKFKYKTVCIVCCHLHLKGEENDIHPVLVDAWTVLKVIFKKKKVSSKKDPVRLGHRKGKRFDFHYKFSCKY